MFHKLSYDVSIADHVLLSFVGLGRLEGNLIVKTGYREVADRVDPDNIHQIIELCSKHRLEIEDHKKVVDYTGREWCLE